MKRIHVFFLLSAAILLGASGIDTPPAPLVLEEVVSINLQAQAQALEPIDMPVFSSIPPNIEEVLKDRLSNTPLHPPSIEIYRQIEVLHTDWQLGQVLKWREAVEFFMEDFYIFDPIVVLAIIGQESGGNPTLICDFDGLGVMCGVGLMQVVPRPWTPTVNQLLHPFVNIRHGERMVQQILTDATEMYGFAPGYDALRASLAAYNCGWVSLLAERCYDFGGYTYADNILDYWIPVLEQYEAEH